MLVSANCALVEVFAHEADDEFIEIRRKAKRWADNDVEALKTAAPWMPDGFENRLAANWRLMFAIADSISPEWGEKLRAVAVQLTPDDQNIS
jgi:hypothetical protein